MPGEKLPHPMNVKRQNTIKQTPGSGINPKTFYQSNSLPASESIPGSDKKKTPQQHQTFKHAINPN